MIRHLVHLKFRSDVTQEEKDALYADLAGLSGHIGGIIDFQHRENISIEDAVVHGFRDIFWFDFRDLAVRDAYVADHDHQAIGVRIVKELTDGAEGVFVCDIEV